MEEKHGPPLGEQLGRLLESSGQAKEKRQLATHRKMEEIERRLKHIAMAVTDWRQRFVIPRLSELAARFPNAVNPVRDPSCEAVCVAFVPTQEFPVEARLSVAMRPDPTAEKIRVTVTALLMPVQADFDREAWLDLWVHSPDTKKLGEFLDARIVRFVEDYLSVRDPASPYQAERVATDPVCQMTIPIVDAVCSVDYRNHTYYFCVDECRKRFEADPDRYVKVVG